MARLMKYLLLVGLLGWINHSTAQQTHIETDSLTTEIHFRWDRSKLDTLYLGNDRALQALDRRIDSIGLSRIDSVVIISQSSPEGPWHYNQNLSARRAATMRKEMMRRYPALTDRLSVNPDGESWSQLREYVRTDQRLKNSSIDRVLKIIDDRTISIETRKRRITDDPVYRYLYRTYYPLIRNSMICVVYYRAIERTPSVDVPAFELKEADMGPRTFPHELFQRPPLPQRDTLTVALKTNLLYDAVTALNFEVEVPIGRHWSVAVEDLFPWWESSNKYCLQLWEMGLEGRYYFRDNYYHAHKLQGHFLGGYAMSGKYDFQRDYDACYQGEFWSAGITYGYSMRLSRRFNLEFSISVGYLSTAYRHYFPADDYSELWRDHYDQGRKSYFGPTKAKIALVWPLQIPYKKKGGRR